MSLGSFFNLLAPGDKPAELTPQFKDLTQIQSEATAGNLAGLPDSEKLASLVDAYNLSEHTALLAKSIPGYAAIQDQIGKNLLAGTRGELAPGTVDWLKRITAEGAIGSGTQGSQAANFSAAENIGKTAEQIQSDATTSFERWSQVSKANAVPQTFDLSSMFLSPIQRIGVEDQRSGLNFQASLRNAAIEAAPDPFMKALAGDLGSTVDSGVSMLGSYLGGLSANVGNVDSSKYTPSAGASEGGGGGGGM